MAWSWPSQTRTKPSCVCGIGRGPLIAGAFDRGGRPRSSTTNNSMSHLHHPQLPHPRPGGSSAPLPAPGRSTTGPSHHAGRHRHRHQNAPRCRSYGGRGGGPSYGGGREGGGLEDSGLLLGPGAFRGGRGGGQGRGGGPQRLIIPGRPGGGGGAPPSRPQQLIVDAPPGLAGGADGADAPPLTRQYRPPPGFMDDAPADNPAARLEPEVMLSRLRARSGKWHELAKLVPALVAKGYDSTAIDEATGVNPAEQNRWIVAGTVYDSIAATRQIPAEDLEAYDYGGEAKLYHFRFLATEQRVAAARYILDQGLDEQRCEVLARAMKEWERRPGERAGFSHTPGDCLAFKFLRDAIECRLPEDAAEKLQAAFEVVETQEGRERLVTWRREVLEGGSGGGGGLTANTMLNVLRLTVDELGTRPLPQTVPYGEVSCRELLEAPRCTQEGAFGAFTLLGDNAQQYPWVALPQWKTLLLARHPVALPIADCAACQDVVQACKAKTDEDLRRMQGAGLLVVDIDPPETDVDPSAWYLVQSGSGGVQLAEGSWLLSPDWRGVVPVAQVLFLARPPIRESNVTSSEMLQV